MKRFIFSVAFSESADNPKKTRLLEQKLVRSALSFSFQLDDSLDQTKKTHAHKWLLQLRHARFDLPSQIEETN